MNTANSLLINIFTAINELHKAQTQSIAFFTESAEHKTERINALCSALSDSTFTNLADITLAQIEVEQNDLENRLDQAQLSFLENASYEATTHKPRTLKISETEDTWRMCSKNATSKPAIRLQGAWLANAGFKPSDRVTVTVQDRKLTITPQYQAFND